MPYTIKKALEEKREGFYIGHRLILPFKCQLIKFIVEGEIFTELVGSKHIKIHQDAKNTSIYIRSIGKLDNLVDSYKVIKMVAAELEDDLCDPDNHIKLICEIKDNHKLAIHQPSEDMLFIE